MGWNIFAVLAVFISVSYKKITMFTVNNSSFLSDVSFLSNNHNCLLKS